MSRYFTSDLHLGSTLINKYAHRPFTSAEEAVKKLTETINSMLTLTDSLIHVGDFMLTGKDQHGNEIDVGLDFDRDNYLRILKTRVVLLSGNHDDGHNAEADCRCMLIDLNQNYRQVTVGHVPSDHRDYEGNFGDKRVHIHLCGHVHDTWLVKYDVGNNVLNVNVGVDVWDYKPVRDSDITQFLDYIFKGSYHPFLFKKSWTMTRSSFDAIVENDKQLRKQDAIARKAERYARKGLTPEECERRKREAMAKKGLKKNA